MNRKYIRIILCWLAVLLWMILIFSLSSQVADESSRLSTGITQIIVKMVNEVVPNINFDLNKFGHVIRKCAHFFEYLVMGIFVINAMKRKQYKYIALLICILYAITDEFHQRFVPGRGPGIKDVLIDSIGASVGIWMYLSLRNLFRNKK